MQILDGTLVLSASDLVGHLACAHLSRLEREAAAGMRTRPVRRDPALDVLEARGFAHEERFLGQQRAAGRTVVVLPQAPPRSIETLRAADARTLEAMRGGADVIAQAAFFDGRWQGRADFLLRVPQPSRLGPWRYEVADAKLSRTVKGAAVLQLCVYADHLARLQGEAPEHVYVLSGDGALHRFRTGEYAAYFRAVRRRFEAALDAAPAASYPDPVDHCHVCRWWAVCADRRRDDDHLCRVAGITRAHTAALAEAGVTTLSALAERPLDRPAPGLRVRAYQTLREQARLQGEQYRDGRVRYELLPPDPDRPGAGLAALPEPSAGDVFLDLEADPWAGPDGLEYLLGTVVEEDGAPVYTARWAHSAEEERDQFDALIGSLMERLLRFPDMHVYHYGAYEKAALRRLAMRHAIRADELDVLLRGERLVDLFAVVRQGVRVSDESYSLKKVEKLYLPQRDGPVTHLGFALVRYEEWLDSGEPHVLDELAAYNRDDCVSVWMLRRWLEERRAEAADAWGPLPRREPKDGAPKEEAALRSAATERRVAGLREGVPAARDERDDEQQARWLLAALLEWHHREEKPEWWRHFDLRDRAPEELVASGEALADLTYRDAQGTLDRSIVHRYAYDPAQEHPFKPGDKPVDPADEKGAGEVYAVDRAAGTIDLLRGATSSKPHPRTLLPGRPIPTTPLRDAIAQVADHVLAAGPFGGAGPYRAVRDLLLRTPPRARGTAAGAPLLAEGEDVVAGAKRLVLGLDDSYLPIQGPPGSGKTYTGAQMVLALLAAGRRVGITAFAHRAISNLVDAVLTAADTAGQAVRIVQKADERQAGGNPRVLLADKTAEVAAAMKGGRYQVCAGTAWLFAAADMKDAVDVLFVDEAGQLSLANVVAMGGAARSIVLLGDPNQLPQVTQATHPEGAEASALEHVLAGRHTIAPEAGLFLAETRRLHPALCAYVSESFYEGRLRAHPSTGVQRLGAGSSLGEGAGIVFRPVPHRGNGPRSVEEAALAADLVSELVACTWTSSDGRVRRVTASDVLLVAPYNLQVAELDRAVRERVQGHPRAGTVDRFQGQEGVVAIYSLATSTPEHASRTLEFLFSRHRLNVAVSRARCFAVVLGSPDLLAVNCRTPELMRKLNAFWLMVERSPVPPAG